MHTLHVERILSYVEGNLTTVRVEYHHQAEIVPAEHTLRTAIEADGMQRQGRVDGMHAKGREA